MKVALISQDVDRVWRRHTELYGGDCHHIQEISRILTQHGISVSTWNSVKSYLDGRQERNTEDEIVFSLIENCFERNCPALIPSLWEMLGIPYVGNDAYAFTVTSDKMLFQDICHGIGLKCPCSFEISASTTAEEIQKNVAERHLAYPFVLKYRYGTMSYGLSIAQNFSMLLSEVERLLSAESESLVLCQEYIPGMEATVPIVGTDQSAHALALIQYTEPDQKPLYLYDTKWKFELDDLVELVPFPNEDPFTKNILQDCLKLHRHLGLRDMSRIDLRITASGDVYFLEANCIPGLGYHGAFDPRSYGESQSFDDIILEIVRSAWLRAERRGTDACPQHDPRASYIGGN